MRGGEILCLPVAEEPEVRLLVWREAAGWLRHFCGLGKKCELKEVVVNGRGDWMALGFGEGLVMAVSCLVPYSTYARPKLSSSSSKSTSNDLEPRYCTSLQAFVF